MKLKRHTLILFLGLIASLVHAQTTLVSNTGATVFSAPGFPGQSFTTPNDGTADLMTGFTWLDNADLPMGAGQLFVFSQEYLGLPTGLAGGTGLMATSNFYASGSYAFTSGVTLNANTQYWVYSGTSQQVGRKLSDFAGGDFYLSTNAGTNLAIEVSNDATFIVSAIPEPSTYAAAAGLAALGLAAWRRRPRVALA